MSFLADSLKSVDIYAPSFSDRELIVEIERICQEGKTVRLLLADYNDADKTETNIRCVQVRKMKKPLHAKAIIQDKNVVFV
jgi:hypothetical protein